MRVHCTCCALQTDYESQRFTLSSRAKPGLMRPHTHGAGALSSDWRGVGSSSSLESLDSQICPVGSDSGQTNASQLPLCCCGAERGILIEGQPSTPGTLNAWLRNNGGYVPGTDDFEESAAQKISPSHIRWTNSSMHRTNDLEWSEVVSAPLKKPLFVLPLQRAILYSVHTHTHTHTELVSCKRPVARSR